MEYKEGEIVYHKVDSSRMIVIYDVEDSKYGITCRYKNEVGEWCEDNFKEGELSKKPLKKQKKKNKKRVIVIKKHTTVKQDNHGNGHDHGPLTGGTVYG